MELIWLMLANQQSRELAGSALPHAPTVPAREPTPRIPGTRRAMASGLRWAASRIEPRIAC